MVSYTNRTLAEERQRLERAVQGAEGREREVRQALSMTEAEKEKLEEELKKEIAEVVERERDVLLSRHDLEAELETLKIEINNQVLKTSHIVLYMYVYGDKLQMLTIRTQCIYINWQHNIIVCAILYSKMFPMLFQAVFTTFLWVYFPQRRSNTLFVLVCWLAVVMTWGACVVQKALFFRLVAIAWTLA